VHLKGVVMRGSFPQLSGARASRITRVRCFITEACATGIDIRHPSFSVFAVFWFHRPQHLQHLSCYRRYTRACLYVDKGGAVADVAECAWRKSLAAQVALFGACKT
jgi:hypothetical protein